MNNFLLIFLYFVIIINISAKSDPLIIPFESTIPKDLTPDNYFSSLFINELHLTIEVGSQRQKIPCYLNSNSHTLYICGSDAELNNGQPKYDEHKSTTYHNTSSTTSSESFYVVGIPSNDEICINNAQIAKLKFYLAKSRFSSNELTYSCMIGLGYEEVFYDDDDAEGYLTEIESFISQIKNQNIINKKVFFIKYNENDDNGHIIFGGFPHQLKDKFCKSCKEEEYIEGDNVYTGDIQIIWAIKGYIYSGEKLIFNYLSSIEFELNQGFIIGSYSYKKEIENNFFRDKISKEECFTQEIYEQKKAFDGYYCKKDVDITKFEPLIIILDKIKYKIEFTYDDLFTVNGNYIYFNVLFTQDENNFNNDFILGKPLFKKYPVVYDFVRRSEKLGFYNNMSFKPNNNMGTSEGNNGGGKKLTIILILIGIIIICLLYYIIVRYLKAPRKTKVNELIEFYDYSAKQGNA